MGSLSTASILHADLDAFYASVAQLKEPELVGRPVIVGGGVVLSASYEARRYGVEGGMGGREARRLCPHAVWVTGEFTDYVEMSRRVFDVCRDFTPLVEKVSIDEAFMDVAGARRLLGEAPDIAMRLRAAVQARTGLVVSVGVARTKFLAKVASQVAKPDGLEVVDPAEELPWLHALPVGMVWGVGPVMRHRLAGYGIATVGELARVPPPTLVSWLGPGIGRHLHALAWNRDPRGVVPERRQGSVGAQSAFGQVVRFPAEHARILRRLADRVAGRMRRKGRVGRTVTVRVRFDDFESVSRALTLPAPVGTAGAIYRVAAGLVAGVVAEYPGRELSLLAISVSKLAYRASIQLELPLFPDSDPDAVLRAGSAAAVRADSLESSLYDLRERFGREAVGPGASMFGPHREPLSMGLLVDSLAEEDR